jgi:hypothetical protein
VRSWALPQQPRKRHAPAPSGFRGS